MPAINSILRPLLFLVFIVWGHPSAFAEGPVWEVSKGGHKLYIGGTIHILAKEDFPLPTVFDEAYAKAEHLVFEINPDDVNTLETQQIFMKHMLYKDGHNLSQGLSQEVYKQLATFLSSRGLSIASFAQYKPGMMIMMLSVMELQRQGMTQDGVDSYYSKKANEDGKIKKQLESINDQVTLFSNMTEALGNEAVQQTLRDLERLPEMITPLKAAWRKGDMTAMAQAAELDVWQRDYPKLYNMMFVKRNNAWLPQIQRMLETTPTELVLVGALHLAGPHSVLTQLQSAGYQITPL